MHRILSLTGALALTACATTAPPPVAAGPCNHDALAGFTGQKASAETGAALLAASGARTLRWGRPRHGDDDGLSPRPADRQL